MQRLARKVYPFKFLALASAISNTTKTLYQVVLPGVPIVSKDIHSEGRAHVFVYFLLLNSRRIGFLACFVHADIQISLREQGISKG